MTHESADDRDSPIEAYLDQLVVAFSTSNPRRLRHLLAETEAHLRDDAAATLAGGAGAGMSVRQAETVAVSRFGSVRDLVAAESQQSSSSLSAVLRQVFSTAVFLGSIGGLAVGVSGLVAAVIRGIGGTQALVDTTPGQVLSPSDCARWLAADPSARTCHAAALQDWGYEVVFYRLALGLLAAAALVVYQLLVRRGAGPDRWRRLPGRVTNTVAATTFAIAGCWTLALGVDAIIRTSGHGVWANGAGQWLSAAPVALAAAVFFSWRLVNDLRSDNDPTDGLAPLAAGP